MEGLQVTYLDMWHNGHFGVIVFTFNVVGFGRDFVMVIFGIFFDKVMKMANGTDYFWSCIFRPYPL